MFLQILNIVFPIFFIVLVGFLYARRHAPDMTAANHLNLGIFVPALIFDVVSRKDFDLLAYQGLVWGGLIVVLGSGLLAWPVAKWFKFDFKTFGPPMMFSNSGNTGLPLAMLAFGEQILPAAIVLFLIENSLHFSLGVRMINSSASLIDLLKVPMLVATFAGLAVGFMDISIPQFVRFPIEMLGQIAIPLMLLSLGVRLTTANLKDWRMGAVGAVVCPVTGVILAYISGKMLGLSEAHFNLLLVFGILPPAVLNFMVAERYNQDPKQVASIVILGNLASLITIPLILAVIFYQG